jgi:large repetitive protein
MKTGKTLFRYMLTTIFYTLLSPLSAQFAGGSGISEDPYQVANAGHLHNVRDYPSAWFIQTADIDLDTTPFNEGNGWEPIGTSTSVFIGNYNGQGHAIINLYINRPASDSTGLFGVINKPAVISNLGLINCSVTGKVSTGAIAGKNDGTISSCYSTGLVKGTENVGGIAGYNHGWTNAREGLIINCYSMAYVYASIRRAGGITGYNHYANVTNSYAAGGIQSPSNAGGLIGSGNGSLNNSFWNTETSAQLSGSGAGISISQMQTGSTFSSTGWDFMETWAIAEGESYPYLQSNQQSPLPGPNPFLIATIQDLDNIRNLMFGHYQLVNDMDFLDDDSYAKDDGWEDFKTAMTTDEGFTPLGSSSEPFTGLFDGNAYSIKNLYINRPESDNTGFISMVGGAGKIIHAGLTDASVFGKEQVGALAGRNAGTISQCFSSGYVTGTRYAGGLVGFNYGLGSNNMGLISNSYSVASVHASNNTAGGLLGHNSSAEVINCYAAGGVSASSGAGGLVGGSYFGSVESSFWNTETTTQLSSIGGTGINTSQMMTLETFTGEGWDFVNTWSIISNETYPYLINNPQSPLPGSDLNNLDILKSTFNTDAEGWTIHTPSDPNTTLTWHETGGNPGGYVRLNDGAQGTEDWFAAPDKFLGDKSEYYGGILKFDLRHSHDLTGSQVGVRLIGSAITIQAIIDRPNQTWMTYTISLSEGHWTVASSDSLASGEEILQVLGNIITINIHGDYRSGTEQSSLDNVMMILPFAIEANAIPFAICVGQNCELFVNASGGSGSFTFSWTSEPPGFFSALQNPVVSPEINTVYYVEASDVDGIIVDSVSVDVYLNEPPSPLTNVVPEDNTFNVQQPVIFSWSQSSNTSHYNLYIWRSNQPKPDMPTVSDIKENNYTYSPYLNTNYIYKWQVVAMNPCFETPGEIYSFAFMEFPDLVVTEIVVPDSAHSGSTMNISYKIANTGLGITGLMPWSDRVYLSQYPVFDPDSSILAGTFQNVSFLEPEESYTKSVNISLDNYLEGQFYVFVVADVFNNIQETIEENNLLRSENPVVVIMSPYPDLLVRDVEAITNSIVPGSPFSVGWIVENIGEAVAAGGWSQKVSVMNGPERRLLGFVQHTDSLAAAGILSQSATFNIPKTIGLEGDYFLEVQLIPNPGLIEMPGGETNNLSITNDSILIEKRLFLTVSSSSIQENATQPVNCTVTRSGKRTAGLIINPEASEDNRVLLPDSVIIPVGQSGIIFPVYAVDNDVFEGNIELEINAIAQDYSAAIAALTVIDDEVSALVVNISEAVAYKGDTVLVSITREWVNNSSLGVAIITSKPELCQMPINVIIEPGEATTNFELKLLNNGIADLPQQLVITAYSPGYLTWPDTILVMDNNLPQIEFQIFPDTVSESGGAFAAWGTISRVEPGDQPITVLLSANPANQVFFPTQVIIPANVMERQFNIGVIDNNLLDGTRDVEISATIYLASCNCGASSEIGGVVNATLTILDNDGPSLSVYAEPFVVPEGIVNAGSLFISRNTPTDDELQVNIHNSHPGEIELPSSVVIPVGQTTIEVLFSTIDDEIEEGDQYVIITVSADDFNTGNCWVMVTDRSFPDLVISDLVVAVDSIYMGQQLPVELVINNNGFKTAAPGVGISFYLSKYEILDKDDAMISYFSTDSQINMGSSIIMHDTLVLDGWVGSYYLIAVVNEFKQINELIYINNQSVAVPINVVPDYYAVASVDGDVFNGKTPVTINGFVKTQDNLPAPHMEIDVYVIVDGARRVLKTVSNDEGNFSVYFQPVNGEAGHFIVGACFPGLGLTYEQDDFIVTGLKYIGQPLQWGVLVDQPLQGSLQVKNFSSIPLNNVSIDVISIPQHCELIFDPIGNLPGNATIDVNFTLTSSQPTDGLSYEDIKLRINSVEGSDFNFTAKFNSKSSSGYIKASPVSFVTTMVKGQSNIREFEIQNIGLGETGLVSIDIPSVEWMTLICPDTISSIPPGAAAAFTLKLTPTPELPLNAPLTGNFVINCANANNLSVPFSIETVSTSTGSLLVDVVDEYTYFTEGAPHVDSAHVILRHPYTGALIAEGLTDVNGHFFAENIPEGYYTLTVHAFKHESYQNTIFINQGQLNSRLVFISFQAISYFWEVIPTHIDDQYEINLIVEYETNVPAPVIHINMPDILPHLEHGEQFSFLVTLTNIGLITAEDVELFLPKNDSEYEYNTLFEKMDIDPNQTIQIPVVMKRRDNANYRSDIYCENRVVVGYRYECGPHTNYQWVLKQFTIPYWVCYGSSGPGSGGALTATGGGTYSSATIPITYTDKDCRPDSCLYEMLDWILNCIICSLPIPGVQVACVPIAIYDCFKGVYGACHNPNSLACAEQVARCLPDLGNIFCFYDLMTLCSDLGHRNEIPSFLIEAQNKAELAIQMFEVANLSALEFYGESIWLETLETEVVFFLDYLISLGIENTIQITPELLDHKPGDITDSQLENFVERWNNTIYMIEGMPFDTTNYINLSGIDSYIQSMINIDSLIQQVFGLSPYEMVESIFSDLENGLMNRNSLSGNTVCATITLNFSQSVTMTREAFEGTLTLYNGHDSEAIQNVTLGLEIRDENGVLSNDLFQLNTHQLDKLTGIDGEGLLNALQTGRAVVQFIPTKNAAPNILKSYSFGGTLSYLDPFTNETVLRPLYPVTLQVNPGPDLYLDYFMQRNILGDDALTPQIEPSIPAELGVMINNQGAGDALNVQLSSAQPEIIDNEKGLLIDFQIVGSNLSGQPVQLGLLDVNFGNIPAGEIAIGQWWFTSSLLGHFVSYEATVKHLDSYGNPDLSLIGGIQIHELIKSVYVYGEHDDGISDFLVNDIPDSEDLPDALYYSNGIVAPVYQAANSETDGLVTPNNLEIELSVAPSSTGWNYTRLDDPGAGNYRIISCTREDGQLIPLDNIWLTHVTLPDGGEPIYENRMHFIDKFPSSLPFSYTVVFEMLPQNILEVLAINGIPEGVIDYPLANVQVVFNKPIDPETFSYEDMILINQGGPNLMDFLVVITQLNDTVYDVDISSKTLQNGYYTLTVHTSGIADFIGNFGQFGKQVSWIQAFDVPVVQRFFGHPAMAGDAIDALFVYFNMPIVDSTFTIEQIVLTKNGGDTLSTENLLVTMMDTNHRLFRISELLPLNLTGDFYELTIKVTEIRGESGYLGVIDQSVQWAISESFELVVNAGEDGEVCDGIGFVIGNAFTNSPVHNWVGGDGHFEDFEDYVIYYPGNTDISLGQAELCLSATTTSGSMVLTDCMLLTIIPKPEVNCPENMFIQVNELPLTLTGATPSGGFYSGVGIADDIFNPDGTNLFGFRQVFYIYTDENGCQNTCSFTIRVDTIPPVYLNELIITSGEEFCQTTTSIIMTENFFVETGAIVELVAGHAVLLKPDTKIHNGAYLHAFIFGDTTYCEQPASSIVSELLPESVDKNLSTETYKESFFKVYPNPTTGLFSLELTESNEYSKAFIEIVNMLGERILRMELQAIATTSFDLSNHQPGIYLIRVMMGDEVGVEKIIKN